jgi:hypothetical protein
MGASCAEGRQLAVASSGDVERDKRSPARWGVELARGVLSRFSKKDPLSTK